MEGEENLAYQSLRQDTIRKDNAYEFVELSQTSAIEERRVEQPKNVKKSNNKELTWNKPIIIIIIVLLSLIVILQVGILCLLLAHMSTRDTTYTAGATTGATTGNNEYPNFTQWANDIVNEVNSNVTGSLPDFNEWANGVSQNTLQLFQNSTNFTELDKQILQTTRDSAQKLINIVNTLSNLQDTSTSTAGVVDDTLLAIIELLLLHNSSFSFLTSCKQIKNLLPNSQSGYYVLASVNGSADYTAYCNMEELCGSGGGWTRLAYLNMTDSTVNCPSGFRLYQSGGVRACGRATSSVGSCTSVQFPSNGISYSQVCGRVTGYQYYSPNAVDTYGSNHSNLNGDYVDGVSITRGSPRQHVWTLMAGYSDSRSSPLSCPCNTGSTVSVQSFIGNNYFCESGNTDSFAYNTLYTSDPLWDGQGCGSLESPCCNVPGIPWFHRDYGNTTTTGYIELRVCGDEGTDNEDAPVSYYEIYVK